MDAMIDLETLATSPRAAIVSIGAVAFNRYGLSDTFSGTIDIEDYGYSDFDIDSKTLKWWFKQSNDIVSAAFPARSTWECCYDMLLDLSVWLNRNKIENCWSHGAAFDLPILVHAFKSLNVEIPSALDYRNFRDTRTLFALTDDLSFLFLQKQIDATLPSRNKSQKHDALQDATWQALAVIKKLNAIYAVFGNA